MDAGGAKERRLLLRLLRRAGGYRKVRRLQTIISHRTRRSQSNVYDRSPSLQLVMPIPMKQVRRADRYSRRRGFYRQKGRMIVHDIIRQQNLLSPASPHVQGRKIIQCPRSPDSREQPIVFLIPKPVFILVRSFVSGNFPALACLPFSPGSCRIRSSSAFPNCPRRGAAVCLDLRRPIARGVENHVTPHRFALVPCFPDRRSRFSSASPRTISGRANSGFAKSIRSRRRPSRSRAKESCRQAARSGHHG